MFHCLSVLVTCTTLEVDQERGQKQDWRTWCHVHSRPASYSVVLRIANVVMDVMMLKWLQRAFIWRTNYFIKFRPSTELSRGVVWPETSQKCTIGSDLSSMEPFWSFEGKHIRFRKGTLIDLHVSSYPSPGSMEKNNEAGVQKSSRVQEPRPGVRSQNVKPNLGLGIRICSLQCRPLAIIKPTTISLLSLCRSRTVRDCRLAQMCADLALAAPYRYLRLKYQ